MELIYLWVEEYKNIHEQGFNFSSKFHCHYDGETLTIKENIDKKGNKQYIENFFGDNINVTAIVGKNGSGKSNLLEILFYKTRHRYKNKITFFIVFFEGEYYLYFFKSGGLALKKKIKMNSSINIKLIEETIDAKESITEYDYLSIFYSNFQEMPYSFNNEEESFIDISTSYLTKIRNRQTFSINNVLRMLEDTSINLPINMPSHLLIELNCKYIGDNPISRKFGKLEHTLSDINDIYFYHFIAELLYQYYKKMKISDEEIDEIDSFEALYELFRKKFDRASFDKLYKIIDIIKDVPVEDNLEIKLSIKSDSKIIDEIVNTINSLNNLFSLRFDVFRFKFDIKMSTGEEVFLFQFANIYDSLFNGYSSDNIVILIDEGETTFHPQWQKEYLSYLIYFLSKNFSEKKFHLILTSHSPFLLSDIPKQNIIFLENGEQVNGIDKEQTFGANIHTLLSDSFFMKDGLMGEFAKGKIMQIKKFHQKVLKYKENEKIKQKYKCFYEKKQKEFEQIQSIIGEPFLKTVIKNYLDEIENILFDDAKVKKMAIKRFIDEFGEDFVSEVLNDKA